MSYDELKKLALAQPIQSWVRSRGRKPDMKGERLMYSVEGPEGVSDYEDWGFTASAAAYIAAANPSAVLALIAENERLKGDVVPGDLLGDAIRLENENDQLKAENEALRSSLDALSQSREALIAQGRNFALDEASHLCFKTAFQKYYPEGTRYKLFTPKMQKAVGDSLVEVANLIAELPDGPYQRYAERQAKLAAIKESGQ